MLTGDLTLSAGTLNGGNATISVAGSWYGASGGSFSAGTSTVTFAGAAGSTSTIFGTNTFSNLASTVGRKTLRFDLGLTLTITGQLTLTGAAGNLLRLRSANDSTTWFLKLLGTQNIGYVDVKNSNASGAALYAGKFSQDSAGNTNWIFDYLPAAVTNFSAAPQSDGSVRLLWSAPLDADDNPLGAGSRYAIEWATYTVVWSTSNAADTGYALTNHVYVSTSGVNAGDSQVVISTGLSGGATYYFSVWTQDPLGYWSAGLSNGATAPVSILLSVQLDATSYNFGSVSMGATTVSTHAVTLTNLGNVTETYSLSVSTSGPSTVWSVKTSTPTAMDQFALFGVFNGVAPISGGFTTIDIITGTPTAASSTIYAGNQTGVSVPLAGQRLLWLRLDMPPYTSTANAQQFGLTITAGSP